MAERDTPQRPGGARAWIAQALLYAAFALAIGVFSHWPQYRHLPPDTAVVKLSMVHAGKPVGECRRRTPEELAALPPNMRAPVECPRERSPLAVELDVDGERVVQVQAPPSGLSRDGASAIYRRLTVPAGERLLGVRMRDDVRSPDFGYRLERRVQLAPGEVVVIDFDAEQGGITLR